MVTSIIQGLMPLVAFSASLSATYTPSASMQSTTSTPAQEERYFTVKDGDTLMSIAFDLYGSEDYWTLLWNDNEFIESPQLLEVNSRLKIRSGNVSYEELKDELKSRVPTLTPVMSNSEESSVSISQPEPVAPLSGVKVLTDAQIAYLGQCESGMTANRNSGNGYFGAFQFSIATWNSMNTGYARADLAPLEVQIDAVQRLLQRSSIFTQFPGCARKMQANGII